MEHLFEKSSMKYNQNTLIEHSLKSSDVRYSLLFTLHIAIIASKIITIMIIITTINM